MSTELVRRRSSGVARAVILARAVADDEHLKHGQGMWGLFLLIFRILKTISVDVILLA